MAADWKYKTNIKKREGVIFLFTVISICVILSTFYTKTPKNNQHKPNTSMKVLKMPSIKMIRERKPSTSDKFDGSRMVHWTPDWLNRTDIGIMLKERKRVIKFRCKEHPPKKTVKDFVLVNNPRGHSPAVRYLRSETTPKLRYCCNAKTGTTFIKQMITALNNRYQRHPHGNDRSMRKDIHFVTVRNPWHRLVSTYIEKFVFNEVGVGNTTETWNYRRQFCARSIMSIGKTPTLTFSQFVTHCVIHTWKNDEMNIHWLPGVYRCEICSKNYNYIIATENLNAELHYVLKQAELVENISEFLQEVRDQSIRDNERAQISHSFQDYYRNLSYADIALLREFYREEFELLGYPDSPFVDSKYA